MQKYYDNTRYINGKYYGIAPGRYLTKQGANTEAHKRRRKGYLVRVVRLENGWYLFEHRP